MADKLLKNAQKLLKSHKTSGLSEKFLKIFHDKLYAQDREVMTDVTLSELSHSFGKLLEEHKPGKDQVKIYSPNLKDDNWEHDRTVIHVVTNDKSFVVDSVAAELLNEFGGIYVFIHPRVYVARGSKKEIVKLAPKETKKETEVLSCLYIELNSVISKESVKHLTKRILEILSHVEHATSDWQTMLGVVGSVVDDMKAQKKIKSIYEKNEYVEFLNYLKHDNFTFLGYQYVSVKEKSGKLSCSEPKSKKLGVMKDDISPRVFNPIEKMLPSSYKDYIKQTDYVTVAKDTAISSVHRQVPYDVVLIKDLNKSGKVVGEHVFAGLFTSSTYSKSVFEIPIIREKAKHIIDSSATPQKSHNLRARRHILEKYPRDELFAMSREMLAEYVSEIMSLQERQTVAMFPRISAYGRLMSCIVYVPKSRFETNMRLSVQRLLEEELNAETKSFKVQTDDSPMSRVQYILQLRTNRKHYDFEEIAKKLRVIARSWTEDLKLELINKYDDKKAFELINRYQESFPPGYRHQYPVSQALYDIERLEKAYSENKLQVTLYRPTGMHGNKMRLRLCRLAKPVDLSDILPIISNMGMRVISEIPNQIEPTDHKKAAWIHDLLLESSEDGEASISISKIKENFEDAIPKLWYGHLEKDLLNSLIVKAGLDWRAIQVLRAYVRYLRQLRYPYSMGYVIRTLVDNPDFAKAFWRLFQAQFNPETKEHSDVQSAGIAVEIDHMLDKVSSLDHDKILRSILRIMRATLRTNFYQTDDKGNPKPYISLKIKSRSLEDVPKPRPWVEIFVYSPDVEGVHLRFGPIARGGLRWSDRHEDFRTEVLGLVKAQMVKNAVIVPVGSKGGFIVKKPTKGLDREAFQKQGIQCYKTFIRGLLDITDNRSGDKIVPPKNVVSRDDLDPYLVVAADKGTATFSDIANSISQKYGFWLDDAFASGGSAGYDHKKMGITAKGAWESVKRHFRELNHNTQEQAFDVIGVGDMGGDVFGNGMLLSEHIRLIAAFNHRHIFCDPNPDTAKTFKERKRLFESVSGWDGYNTKLLSKGGMIYDRSEKTLKLTKEIRERFGIESNQITPDDLIKEILKARTDLLWFGGIGTYLKAEDETNEEVSDKANDNLRVNAKDVQAKVIGEGANLGVTQKARIEFANHGGKINTDFIDNSAGVDCSDHEVNVKILLQETMMRAAKANRKNRDKLLEKMTDEVSELVLRNNYQQSQALSLMEMGAAANANRYERIMQILEERVDLNREIEYLPSYEEMEERIKQGKGLSRPELSVVLSYSKIAFFNELMASDIAIQESSQEWVIDYFPTELQKKYKDEILQHSLSAEIINTQIANSIINRVGPIFILNCMAKAGATATEVVKAYLMTRDVFGLRQIWDSIEAMDNQVPAELQLKIFNELNALVEHVSLWFLRHRGSIDLGSETLNRFKNAMPQIRKSIKDDLSNGLKDQYEDRLRFYEQEGLPDNIAEIMAILPLLSSICDIIHISDKYEVNDYARTAHIYYEIGQRFKFNWLREKSRHISNTDIWDRRAASGLRDLLFETQSALVVKIVGEGKVSTSRKRDAVEDWAQQNSMFVEQLDDMLNSMEKTSTLTLSMLMIAEQRLRQMT